jgi:hypothetical protein
MQTQLQELHSQAEAAAQTADVDNCEEIARLEEEIAQLQRQVCLFPDDHCMRCSPWPSLFMREVKLNPACCFEVHVSFLHTCGHIVDLWQS